MPVRLANPAWKALPGQKPQLNHFVNCGRKTRVKGAYVLGQVTYPAPLIELRWNLTVNLQLP